MYCWGSVRGTVVGAGGFGAVVGVGAGVGCAAVGGNGVDGAAVGGTAAGFGASAIGGGCFCVLKGSSVRVVPHPIAMIAINTRAISFTVMRHLCSLAPANADQCLRLEYYKALPSNYPSSMSVPLWAV